MRLRLTDVAGVGADGCRGGWVVALLRQDAQAHLRFVEHLDEVVAQLDGSTRLAVDIPIGLVDDPRREADVAARGRLTPRTSSVFGAPCRSVLDAFVADPTMSFRDALRLNREATGLGISRQSFHLLPRIAEVDALRPIVGDDRLLEVHPEVCFRELAANEANDLPSKATGQGVRRRRDLLGSAGLRVPLTVVGGGSPSEHDVLDAVVAAWTASAEAGQLRRLPEQPRQQDHGRPVAITFRRGRAGTA